LLLGYGIINYKDKGVETMYKVETQNGLILESPSIRDIMQELANYEDDRPVKFSYEVQDRKVESEDVREFYSLVNALNIIVEDKREQEQESRK
jgi:hypothetical protein